MLIGKQRAARAGDVNQFRLAVHVHVADKGDCLGVAIEEALQKEWSGRRGTTAVLGLAISARIEREHPA